LSVTLSRYGFLTALSPLAYNDTAAWRSGGFHHRHSNPHASPPLRQTASWLLASLSVVAIYSLGIVRVAHSALPCCSLQFPIFV
jgi:hypothetical protein